MITYVNNSNAGQYRILYEKATRDLMAHGSENELIKPSDLQQGAEPLITPEVVPVEDLTSNDEELKYEPGKYYRWDDSKEKYIVAEESEYDSSQTYYKANDITSLNQYFAYIQNLAEIDPLYTVLPLDEDVFNVDLNTRKIDIPQHFKDNGVSVQGDEIAEILYFKVNRFFDAQDLAYMINRIDDDHKDRMRIYIQWRSSQTGENGKLIEGVSVPWVVDLTTYPNYILFGWPISSKITGKEGTIDFAIRFFKFQDRNITYSLSSLTHSVIVKPSLDFDITEKLRDIEDHHGTDGEGNSDLVLDDNTLMIMGRLANSEVADDAAAAGQPYFFMYTNEGPDGIDLTTEIDTSVGNGTGIVDGNILTSKGLVPEFWLKRNSSTGILDVDNVFYVEGSGDGRISYKWRKLNIDDKTLEPIEYRNDVYLPSKDTEEQPGKTYYTKDLASENDVFYRTSDPVFDRNDPNYSGPVYERFSEGKIDGVGYYICTISNRVQNSLAKKESIEMVVARPLAPLNNVEVVDHGVLKPADNYELTLTTDAEPQDRSILTYQWYYSKDYNANGVASATPIEGATESTYTIQGSANASALDGADGDGYYYVIITANMNKEQKAINGNTNGTRITHLPTKPIVTIPSTHKESYSIAEIALSEDGLKVQYDINSEAGERWREDLGDGVTYQWYRYVPGNPTDTDEDRRKAAEGLYVLDHDIAIDGATKETFRPTLGGFFYYCIVTNHYNGESVDGYSPFFYITA